MNANNDERMSGAVDQQAFEKVIRDNLSPAGIATIIACLQPAAMRKAPTANARAGLRELEWFADTLIEMIGVDQYDRLLEELCL